MDGKTIRNKLVGSKDERAVSPVIGVILMVAITVILAAVIAAFVLDMGDNMGQGQVNAGVSADVSNTDQQVTISVDTMGDAEEFKLAGENVTSNATLTLNETGDTIRVSNDSSNGEDLLTDASGSANVVAIAGDDESTVTSFDWDWS
nr:type IV pilin N-terminal domain-containing protein [Natrialba asiatica]